ncbi:helix-turn-helix transcriptional regulator [Catenulispora sp. GP43]|uniref:helix-turn-helix transcriptional regulator n=1 Tax=Catenulispora sp. GP43 TaxID=3156263 RepID=UPI0035130768
MSRTLHVDYAAELALSRLFGDLRDARQHAGLTQNELANGMPFRGRAISEWETGAMEPTLEHMFQWSRSLGRRLVIVGPDGEVRTGPARPWRGEPWEDFELRRLAVPLKNRRLALGLTQDGLGWHVGVSRDSIGRWELARVCPRAIGVIVWAQQLGCSIALEPIITS